MPPTKTLITSTCFQQITSYLVHINFSLFLVILQSFQFVGQIVWLLCSLQNVFQMTSLGVQAHLQKAGEIVNNTTMVLRKFLVALGPHRTITRDEQWFQQDGPTPHTSSNILSWLRQRFEDQLISRRCDIEWVPHSPDLTPPPHPQDFYLCGYLNNQVYGNSPHTIGNLKTQLQPGSGPSDNFTHCLQVCLQRQGGHLENILERA